MVFMRVSLPSFMTPVKDHVCWRRKGWWCWKMDTPHSLTSKFDRLSFSWTRSSAGRKANYTSPESNFCVMPIPNTSCEGSQVPLISLGFYCASCNQVTTWLALAGSRWDSLIDSQTSCSPQMWIQNSQQQKFCHAPKKSLEIIYWI